MHDTGSHDQHGAIQSQLSDDDERKKHRPGRVVPEQAPVFAVQRFEAAPQCLRRGSPDPTSAKSADLHLVSTRVLAGEPRPRYFHGSGYPLGAAGQWAVGYAPKPTGCVQPYSYSYYHSYS
eukprot:354246-Chlamydomonas_euryale.AAC.4